MSLPIHNPLVPADEAGAADETTQRGLAIYEAKLRSLLEPIHNGQVVAIHVDSGDHAVGMTSGDAMRAMRKIHSEGALLLHTIGPVVDSGLAARMLGSRIVSRRR